MPSVSDPVETLLVLAHGYIERGWCKGAFSRTAKGYATSGSGAVAWCLEGALERAFSDVVSRFPDATHAYGEAKALIYSSNNISKPLAGWNDARHRVQGDVLRALDKAVTARRQARAA